MTLIKAFKSIVKNLLSKDLPKPMGRWGMEACNVKINHKVDLSNEDHCGPCGQYALSKIESKIELKNLKDANSSTEKLS
jgi:hypothetical protein